MKKSFLKSVFIAGFSAVISVGCSSTAPTIVATPIENIDTLPLKTADLSDVQMKNWGGADLLADTIPGMSVQKAYDELIKDFTGGKKVIVGVIDSGVDIEHEDLDGVIWVNEDEIPNNGKDDDKNGYIDDIHGWNFLGDAVEENLEFVRIYRDLKPKYENKTASSVSAADKEEFELYQKAKAEYEKQYNETIAQQAQYNAIHQQMTMAHEAVSKKLGKENYTKEDLAAMEANTPELQQSKAILTQMFNYADEGIPAFIEQIEEGVEYFSGRIDSHFNLDLNARKIVGDNPDDLNDRNYGNNDVDGPTEDKEDAKHGTHVAGIIAAERNNGIGMNGVANNAEIMVLRAVPDGDEYDKDIALAIRYAVDNGAKVINTSFGKYFSTHPEWVMDAIRYAEENDVLIVNAAGNEGIDLDGTMVYPNDQTPENPTEIADNVLTVGASHYDYGSDLVAGFSNYGKLNVDIFAPGTKIWSTTPNNEYEFLQGTSMAAPNVAGIAAVIRSYYPKLSASEVKHIIMDSGLTTNATVDVGTDIPATLKFSELSTSGKMANLYNALILAQERSKN
ncbi:MAG TPA: S8 family peptidase [Salinimicrobium sp.]|nr:S8 family peptidase [Salinimicrobium sp.]